MFSDLLSAIDGIGTYPVISLILFFLVFVGVAVWVFTTNKDHLNKLASLPLDNNGHENNFEIKND